LFLARATVVMAISKRDKSAAKAIWKVLEDIKNGFVPPVPDPMKDCHYKAAKLLKQGQYHDGINQEAYIPIGRRYYYPE
jgi:replication-associated recombination protein RarA